jgi:hypothetical protein
LNDDQIINVIVGKSQDGNSQKMGSIENAKDTINSSLRGSVEMNKTLPQGFGDHHSDTQDYKVNPDLMDRKVD